MKASFLIPSKAFLRYKIDLNNQNLKEQRKPQEDPEVKVN